MKRKFKIFGLVGILGFLLLENVLGYDADFHKKITEKALSLGDLEVYLEENLGFGFQEEFTGPGGSGNFWEVTTETNTKKVKEWIEYGSWREDNPDCVRENALLRRAIRASRHFYDPISHQGLTDHPAPGALPSLDWAYDYPDNEYSWKQARAYYYSALTSSTQEQRSEYYARTFRALGQVLHLLQDKAVPAHVRNDNHVAIPMLPNSLLGCDYYEHYWVKGKVLPQYSYPVVELDSFREYWRPDSSGIVGLASFTNYNFFSRDTNLDAADTTLHHYDNPQTTGTLAIEWDPKVEAYVGYFKGDLTDDYFSTPIEIEHLTAFSYWDYEVKKKSDTPVYSLNDECHKEYGEYLLPRAVGYSAGLIDYFFRGKLGILTKEAISQGNDVYDLFLEIKNESSLDMTGGALTLMVKEDTSYVNLGEESGVSIASGAGAPPFEWNLSATIPMPDYAEDDFSNIEFTLVYDGQIGQEEGVVGKVFTGVSVSVDPDIILVGSWTQQQIRISDNVTCHGCAGAPYFSCCPTCEMLENEYPINSCFNTAKQSWDLKEWGDISYYPTVGAFSQILCQGPPPDGSTCYGSYRIWVILGYPTTNLTSYDPNTYYAECWYQVKKGGYSPYPGALTWEAHNSGYEEDKWYKYPEDPIVGTNWTGTHNLPSVNNPPDWVQKYSDWCDVWQHGTYRYDMVWGHTEVRNGFVLDRPRIYLFLK